MTREQAVEYIWDLTVLFINDRCCSTKESDDAREETRAALAALGVR